MVESALEITGRILYLTVDPELLRRQLAGEDLDYDPRLELIDNVSTDEIAPSWACYYSDETLGRFALVGLRGGLIERDALARGGFSIIVSGKSKGCGSSRETAPFAELSAGVRLVIAQSFEKIYLQNCQNIGLHTSTDFSLLPRIARGETIPLAELATGLDGLSAEIVEAGGLFRYNRLRIGGAIATPAALEIARPMTLAEKIISRHVVRGQRSDEVGVAAVKPGEALFVRTDIRFSHDYVTKMADALFRGGFGPDAKPREPSSIFLFRDHLTFLEQVMTPEHRQLGLSEQAQSLEREQAAFAERHGLALYGESPSIAGMPGSEAICHNKVIEDLALPSQLVIGTDSHTCMAGVLGCLAFGVGSTDMANAWYTRDVRITVPETVRVSLHGELRQGVCAKDVMLRLLATAYFKNGGAIGKVLEFSGPGLENLAIDERSTLTNMSVEAGAFSGIMQADSAVVDYLSGMRALSRADIQAMSLIPDSNACYAHTLELYLGSIEPMVATPGDPRNGIELARLLGSGERIAIDIAYGGSCTGGKRADIDMYAAVIARALERGRRVAENVHFYIQFGSRHIAEYAKRRGYIELFREAGADLLGPSCGACIRAGPGISSNPTQTTVSAVNRNFPGRSGPGRVYLASPLVVAASAIAGELATPEL